MNGPSVQYGQGNSSTNSNTFGVSNLGNTVGTSGVISGPNAQFLVVGGNNITVSQSINGSSATLTLSGIATSQGTDVLGMSNLGNTSGTTGVISASNPTLVFAGGNNITLSQSLNGASATITISAANAAAGGSQSLGASNLGNTVGTSGIASGSAVQFVFVASNNLTASQSVNGASATITLNASQTSNIINDVSILTAGNTTGTMANITSGTLYLAGGNRITLSQDNNSITIVGNSEGTRQIGISTNGNTAGTTGYASSTNFKFTLIGGNNVTLSQSINGASHSLTISAANQTVESQTFGASNLGNTVGTSGVASGGNVQFILVGSSNVTLSQSINGASGTITINAANQTVESNTFGMSNIGNTSGTTGVVSGGQLQVVLAGGTNITLSQSINGSSATISILGATAAGGGGSTFSEFFAYPNFNIQEAITDSANGIIAIGGASTTSIYAISLPYALTATALNQLISLQSSQASNNNSSRGWSLSAYAMIYTRNDSTLSLLTSGSSAFTTTVSSQAWTSQGSALAQILPVPINVNIGPGLYYVGVAYLTSSTRTNIYGNVRRLDYVPDIQGISNSYLNIGSMAFPAPLLWGAQSTNNFGGNGVGFITATNSTSISGSIAISAIRTFAAGAGGAANNANIPYLHFVNATVAQT